MRGFERWFLVASVVALACNRSGGSSQGDAPASPAKTSAPVAAPPPEVAAPREAPLPRAAVSSFVERWAKLQNAGDVAGYSALYAPDFVGIKRVGDKATTFQRDGWLADRRPMLERDVRVAVSNVQVVRAGTALSAIFDQRWSTSTFADTGQKVLSLRESDTGFLIVREEMLTSRVSAQSERSGACEAGYRSISNDTAEVRHFADLASSRLLGTAPRWAKVASGEAAHERADGGTAWEEWAFVVNDGWQVASLSLSSPSGDWVRLSSYCFRPDGTLSLMTDSHRTFYSTNGLVNDTVVAAYARDGSALSATTDAYYIESGKPAEPDTYMRPPPIVVRKTAELPFAQLLAP